MFKGKALLRRTVFLSAIEMLFLGLVLLVQSEAFSAELYRTRLIGHSNLHGRPALQVALRGNYAYCGHHRGQAYNPMTGETENNGTTIVDVSNPEKPFIVKHIPGALYAESRAVQVV